MSVSVYKLEKDLCRCCHAEGSFHNLAEPAYNLGQKEVYSEMLQNSLDVEILPIDGELSEMTFTICDACVLRLRDAHNFKQQVALCEQRFKEMYKHMVLQNTLTIEVKMEPPGIVQKEVKQEFDIEIENDGFDIKFDDSDDDQPVIKIKVEEPKKGKARPKAARTKAKTKKAPPKKPSKQAAADDDDAQEDGDKPDDEGDKKKGTRTLPKCAIQESDYRIEGNSYICARCEKKYDYRYALMDHIRIKHYKIPRYPCPYCKLAFMTPAPLTVHKLEIHHIDDRFKCKACNAAFNTKPALVKHINIFHKQGKKYKCEFCEYESSGFDPMYKHKFKHRIEKNYHCKFCKKSFLRKTTLVFHERIHTGDKKKVCKVCGQAFVQKASLNYHMTKYHPEVNF